MIISVILSNMNNRRWVSPSPFTLYTYIIPFILILAQDSFIIILVRSISVLTLFGWCTCYYSWTIQYSMIFFLLCFPFYFSLYLLLVCCQTLPQLLAERRSEHITLWDISIKDYAVFQTGNCFTDWTPCFPLPHVHTHFGGILTNSFLRKGI